MAGSFSCGQKFSLAGMFIGSVMCITGLVAPYWLVTDVSLEGIDVPDKLIGGNIGVFMYCVHYVNQERCELLPMDDSTSAIYAVRICGSVGSLLGGICGLVALCLACCGRGSRFIALGVVCFIAAAIGAVAAGVFSHEIGDVATVTLMDVKFMSYGWAFFIYCIGIVLLCIVSFIACFAAPENPIGGYILSQNGPSVVVTQMMSSNPYSTLREPQTMMTAASAPGVHVVNSSVTY